MTMYNDVIYLIKETRTVNEYGDMVVTESERSVFAQVKSIGQSEFYQAAAVGLKPEIKFVIADFLDYDEEKKLRYTPYPPEINPAENLAPGENVNPSNTTTDIYEILRTYRTGNALEIVCVRGVDKK